MGGRNVRGFAMHEFDTVHIHGKLLPEDLVAIVFQCNMISPKAIGLSEEFLVLV
jgi:hypothetical protein